jgi:hypothetical protein
MKMYQQNNENMYGVLSAYVCVWHIYNTSVGGNPTEILVAVFSGGGIRTKLGTYSYYGTFK